MSVVDILVALYGAVDVEAIRQGRPDRSRIIVSKGHCAAAVYAVMHHYGLLSADALADYCREGSLLAGHVSHAVKGVEHSTGALGHGLPVACGCAIGLRSRGDEGSRVFCVMGDGELQEGSVWEALMFARHHRLRNLVPLVDNNRISSITATDRVIDLQPLENRFAGFGFEPYVVDGHDVEAIQEALESIERRGEPGVVICNTVKGRGVPFAENEPIWHYRSLGEEQFRAALAALAEAMRQ